MPTRSACGSAAASTALPWESITISLAGEGSAEAPDRDLATAVAQLAVTGRAMFKEFAAWKPQDNDLATEYGNHFPGSAFAAADIHDAATHVLDAAYTALWAIRSNDPAWRYKRSTMGWIAVSGFDDTPHRPVNVPTAPYPQYDLDVDVKGNTGGMFTVTTRYLVASAGDVGRALGQGPVVRSTPDRRRARHTADQRAGWGRSRGHCRRTHPSSLATRSSSTSTAAGRRPRKPSTWRTGSSSRARRPATSTRVISLDLPNSAYGSTFDLTRITGTSYDYTRLDVLNCVVQYVIDFIEALDAQVGNVKDRIVAVMGGSLGGNTSLLLTDLYDPTDRPYLRTIVSWSVTATAPARYAGLVPAAWLAAMSGLTKEAFSPEPPGDHMTESAYIEAMYTVPLGKGALFTVLPIPPQPIMWFRGGYKAGDGLDWQPCKDVSVARSRFDRYEIYTPAIRHWITALDLEQIAFSFQDKPPMQFRPRTPGSCWSPGTTTTTSPTPSTTAPSRWRMHCAAWRTAMSGAGQGGVLAGHGAQHPQRTPAPVRPGDPLLPGPPGCGRLPERHGRLDATEGRILADGRMTTLDRMERVTTEPSACASCGCHCACPCACIGCACAGSGDRRGADGPPLPVLTPFLVVPVPAR